MSNFAPDFNDPAFNNGIGSSMSPGQLAWDAHSNQVNDAVTRAFQEWPLETEGHAAQRMKMIDSVLDKAKAAFEPFCMMSAKREGRLLKTHAMIRDFNDEFSLVGVRENVGDWMYIWSQAIEGAV